ncbi:unnamed protein product [Lactuca saligna]|uniref:Uncharacterized protein n=1 Tax=Lactuca saligna TaxID=75948 RepID=A0AA35YDC0_LACSI|nr:unnamed protein product [Lactuca saligna]
MVVRNPPSTTAATTPHGFPVTHAKILLFTTSLAARDDIVPMAKLESSHPSWWSAVVPKIVNGSQRKLVGVGRTTIVKLLWTTEDGIIIIIRRRHRGMVAVPRSLVAFADRNIGGGGAMLVKEA